MSSTAGAATAAAIGTHTERRDGGDSDESVARSPSRAASTNDERKMKERMFFFELKKITVHRVTTTRAARPRASP